MDDYREIKGDELVWNIKGYNQAMKEIMNFCEESIETYKFEEQFDYTEEEKQILRLIYQVCKSKLIKL